MGSIKWIAVLVSVVTAALDALANLLLAALTPHAVPDVLNLLAVAVIVIAAVGAIGLHLAARQEAKIDLIGQLLAGRIEELEARIGDRNSGFVEGYTLSRAGPAQVPEASVVPLAPRPHRRAPRGE